MGGSKSWGGRGGASLLLLAGEPSVDLCVAFSRSSHLLCAVCCVLCARLFARKPSLLLSVA